MLVSDLLLFTLGFNVESFQFFEDAQLDMWQLNGKNIFIYKIDIDFRVSKRPSKLSEWLTKTIRTP